MQLTSLFTNPMGFLLNVLYMLPAILIAMSFHEAAHAFVADKMGDNTARMVGRLSLDPLKHIDPLGFFFFVFFGFGWAKPVPVNPNKYNNRRKGELLVSIAGITTNIILGFVFTIIYALFIKISYSNGFNTNNLFVIISQLLAYIINFNFVIAVFNLLPIGPLDGYGILQAIFWGKTAPIDDFMQRYGMILLFGLILTGVIGMVLNGAVMTLINIAQKFAFAIFGL